MPDSRFFQTLTAYTLDDLAAAIGGQVVRGGDRKISGVAPLGRAGADDLAFLSDKRHKAALGDTRAGAVIVSEALTELVPEGAAVVTSTEIQASWARAADLLFRAHPIDLAADPAAWLEDDTVIVEPGVVLGQGVSVGRGSRIGANTVIGPGVQIGRDCQIGANVSVRHALVGDRVRILSGARIGEAGFGAAPSKAGPVDIPQLGRVILQDNVTVGANTCIDRGAFDDTVIGENTKIDNLVQIAHNVVIGRNGLLAAHTGISGSVRVGDNVMFGGRAGIGDHITIGEGARVAGGAGVLADIPPGETWSGYPAKPLRQSLREAVWLAKQVTKTKG